MKNFRDYGKGLISFEIIQIIQIDSKFRDRLVILIRKILNISIFFNSPNVVSSDFGPQGPQAPAIAGNIGA